MNLAVMSDLHIGLAARAKDLCPEPPSASRKDRMKFDLKTDRSYRQKFVQFIGNERISADYLVLPGDLTNQSKPLEVQLASEFIVQVADALGVSRDKIVFAPGNHDLDWTVFDQNDTTGLRQQQRYDPMRYERFHFKRLVDQGVGDVFSSPFFTVWTFDDLLAVAYNSASHDDPLGVQHIHHGLADQNHLDCIRMQFEAFGPPDERLRLFVVHHHLIDYANPLPSTPDFSLMTNAESLLSLLHQYSFDLVIHGHKHHPRFDTHTTATYPHIPILCSGSFSVEIDTQWAGTVDNQFHLVTVNGRAGTENCIKGKIMSWSNNRCRGWIPSEEATSGIHHIIPFGSYVMPTQLDARLEPFTRQWLMTHDHLLWKQVVEEYPELEHLPLDSAIAAFKRIAQRLSRKTMHQTLKDLILY